MLCAARGPFYLAHNGSKSCFSFKGKKKNGRNIAEISSVLVLKNKYVSSVVHQSSSVVDNLIFLLTLTFLTEISNRLLIFSAPKTLSSLGVNPH